MSERTDSILIRVFTHRGRLCAIYRFDWYYKGPYHNGYVTVRPSNATKDYANFYGAPLPEEPTFMDVLDPLFGEVVFLGFDTLHAHDTPDTQSFAAVLQRTIAFADAMVTGGI